MERLAVHLLFDTEKKNQSIGKTGFLSGWVFARNPYHLVTVNRVIYSHNKNWRK